MDWKNVAMGSLLVGIAVIGPMVAYAGVSVIYPSSTKTANINTTPPISFAAGEDHTQASNLGFAGTFTAIDGNAAYTLTVSGLSGGTVTVDFLVNISKDADVTSFKVERAEDLTGTLTTPTTLKVRLWTGATAPTADADAQVCAWLSLKTGDAAESTASCTATTVKMQLVYQLPTGSTGSSTVKLRPSSIVFV